MKCQGCSGHCCNKFVKFITIHDAARILDELKVEPLEFLDLRPAEVESEMPVVKIWGKEKLLALESKMARRDCVFLMEIGNSKKCGIHSIKPMVCRTYPFVLDERVESLGLTSTFLCPRQYWPEGEERDGYIRMLTQAKKERKEYKEIVEEWNREHGEKGNFMQFLDFALGKIRKEIEE